MKVNKNCVECFNAILEPEIQILLVNLQYQAGEIRADYNSRGTLRSTACVSAQAAAAIDTINLAFIKAINDFFSFLNSQYISLSKTDISEVKKVVNERVMAVAKREYESIKIDGLSVDPRHQSRLYPLCNAGSKLLESYIDKEYAKLTLLRGSATVRQMNMAFWFGVSSLALSIMAILVSLLF